MFHSLFILNDHCAGTAQARTLVPEPRRFQFDGLRGTLKSLLATIFMLGCAGTILGDSLPGKVKVMTERHGAQTRFLLRNYETTDMTATLDVAPVNMKSSVPLPCTVTIPAGQTVEALVLTPTNGPGSDWSFNYTNHYTVGRHDATHDDSVLYNLPYAAGTTYKVTQGYHGSFSHRGPDEYSTDWKMPVGTPVHAAREGVVVAVKDDSEKGGAHRKYEDCANMVTIQHADGTMAHYCHLSPHSAKVRVGQRIRTGDLLAASGNTGFTSGPHLHFAVFKARSGFGRQSIPVKFRTANESGISLLSGQNYRAVDPAAMARK